jgi:hypothetical protein
MQIQITPIATYPSIATQIQFSPAEIYYGSSAQSQYILQGAEGQNLASGRVSMTPEQYQQWGNNDEYAISVFLSNLNLTATPSVAEQLAAQV